MNRLGPYCAIAALSVATGCARKWTCDLKGQLEQRAGASARDCGEARADSGAPEPDGGTGPSSVDECVAVAFGKHEAFYAQYPLTGKNAKLVYGVAFAGTGGVAILQYDPDASGGSSEGPTIEASECESPELDLSSSRNSGSPAPFHCTSIARLGETCGAPAR